MNTRTLIILMVGVSIPSHSALSQTQPSPRLKEVGPQTRNNTEENNSSIRFQSVTICDSFVGGYQVAVADMNGDRKLDILALGEHPGTLDWFENPGKEDIPWKRHAISSTLTQRNIDMAAYDVNGDGLPELAVASDFDLGNTARGMVSLFHRQGGRAGAWIAIHIHAAPTAHRIRWADIDGDGRKELITVPLVGSGAKLPGLQEAPAQLMCHWIPKDPFHDSWPEQIIDRSLTVVHGVFVIDWDGDGRDELLIASNQGIHLFKAESTGPAMRWSPAQLAAGHAGEPPNSGSSEVCVGRAKNGIRFLAAIEPWHGNEVVVYTQSPGNGSSPALWRRKVIDSSLRAGHALCCSDLDGDGYDEIVAGYRGEGTRLYAYRMTSGQSDQWNRFIIDNGGIAAQGCVVADPDGDGRTDLVATGGSTHNVKLYLNETRRQPKITPR